MQFQVPQFIEVEDKIFYRLTLKQFLYLAGGLGASVAIYLYIPIKIIAIIIILPVVAFSISLAFLKINKRPFIDVVQSSFYYFFGDKLYLWRKVEKKPVSQISEQGQGMRTSLNVPRISDSKLKDLTWSLNIKENIAPLSTKNEK